MLRLAPAFASILILPALGREPSSEVPLRVPSPSENTPGPEAAGTDPCHCAGGRQALYAFRSNKLYRIDDYASAPKAVLIGTSSKSFNDIAAVPGTGELIGTYKQGEFASIDVNTAADTQLATFPGVGHINSLESGLDGKLIGRTTGGNAGQLYLIDPSVPSATLIGSNGIGSAGDCAYDVDGTLYGVSTPNELVRIDPRTAKLTSVGPIDTTGTVWGLEIDCDGVMYGATSKGQLLRIDKSTATATLIGSLGSLTSVYGLAFVQPALPPIGHHCPATVNSTGQEARMDWSGSSSVASASLTISTTGLPDDVALIVFGENQAQLPFGSGFACIASRGATGTLLGPVFVSGGSLSASLDFAHLPGLGPIQSGDTWHFQTLFRDSASNAETFGASDALRVSFCP